MTISATYFTGAPELGDQRSSALAELLDQKCGAPDLQRAGGAERGQQRGAELLVAAFGSPGGDHCTCQLGESPQNPGKRTSLDRCARAVPRF
jgi:hypothetical protein